MRDPQTYPQQLWKSAMRLHLSVAFSVEFCEHKRFSAVDCCPEQRVEPAIMGSTSCLKPRQGCIGGRFLRQDVAALSLRWKSALTMLALFSFLLLAALGAGYYAVDSIRAQFGAEFARTHVLLQKQKLSTVLSREVAVARRFGELVSVRDWLLNEDDPVRFATMFEDGERFRQVFPDKNYSIVVDKSGHYYSRDGKRDPAKPIYAVTRSDPNNAWYYAVRESGKDYALNVDVNETLDVTKVFINVPVRDGGKPIGLVSSGIDISRFLEDFVQTSTAGLTNLIINGDGVIQAHPDASLIEIDIGSGSTEKTIFHQILADEAAPLRKAMAELRSLGEDGERAVTLHLQGDARLAGITYIPEFDWFVIGAVDLDTAAVLDDKLLLTVSVCVLVGMAGLAVLLTLAIDRAVLNPLARLHRSVSQMSSGNYQVLLNSTRDDELGDLTRAFNHMASEILTHTQQLEHRIEERTRDLANANREVTTAHGAIQDSLRYASLIQRGILPHKHLAESVGEDHFLLWMPRDEVGGDFFVFRSGDGRCVLGVVDCAGHGVPGALMTMIGRTAFDIAVSEIGLADPARVLSRMDDVVRSMMLHDEAMRGIATSMDAALCAVDLDAGTLIFAGARLSLYASNGETAHETAGSRASLADRKIPTFENHVQTLDPDATYYLTTDGYLDQSGGDRGFGFGRRRFLELLTAQARRPMADQRTAFAQALADYQGSRSQRDDITVLSFRFRKRS
jgi:serine phosphatase RsbU (regulator of sigma subunit)